MRNSRDDCPQCGAIDKRLSRMTTYEKRAIFGLPFQQWGSGEWTELFGELPSGLEFAA
jgi:hypothetical protein